MATAWLPLASVTLRGSIVAVVSASATLPSASPVPRLRAQLAHAEVRIRLLPDVERRLAHSELPTDLVDGRPRLFLAERVGDLYFGEFERLTGPVLSLQGIPMRHLTPGSTCRRFLGERQFRVQFSGWFELGRRHEERLYVLRGACTSHDYRTMAPPIPVNVDAHDLVDRSCPVVSTMAEVNHARTRLTSTRRARWVRADEPISPAKPSIRARCDALSYNPSILALGGERAARPPATYGVVRSIGNPWTGDPCLGIETFVSRPKPPRHGCGDEPPDHAASVSRAAWECRAVFFVR